MPRLTRPRPSQILLALSQLLLLGALLLALRYVWVHETTDPVRRAEDPPHELTVRPGQSAGAVAQALAERGLVKHPWLFRALVLHRGTGRSLQAGEYIFEGTLSLDDIVDKLVAGEVARYEVTFPEGKTYEEMAAIASARGVDAKAFLKAARDPAPIRDLDPEAKDLEGYLFPDTYEVTRTTDAPRLVARMLERFREVVVPLRPKLEQRELSLRHLVTLASIVELETARADERPRIAAVFLNRLAKGMLLQTDPSVIYALRQRGSWDGNIRKPDLQLDSPYNTYRFSGLPPGPIAAPGKESLLAVLSPAPTKDLYFVSRNDGSHEFNEDLASHERAVTRYQRQRRRGGA
jgi:UPF0755 protein